MPAAAIGAVTAKAEVSVKVAGAAALAGTTPALRDIWEETSFQLERKQVCGLPRLGKACAK